MARREQGQAAKGALTWKRRKVEWDGAILLIYVAQQGVTERVHSSFKVCQDCIKLWIHTANPENAQDSTLGQEPSRRSRRSDGLHAGPLMQATEGRAARQGDLLSRGRGAVCTASPHLSWQ